MPTLRRDDGMPIVLFDAQLEISPFTLYRRIREDRAPLLVDIRPTGEKRSLHGAIRPQESGWVPPSDDVEVVLFDDDGSAAVDEARRLQESGFSRVKALFGGLDLYEFSLDPELLDSDTFLERSS